MVKMSKTYSQFYMNNQIFQMRMKIQMKWTRVQTSQPKKPHPLMRNQTQVSPKKDRPAPVPGRFARIDYDEIYKFQELDQSAATKKNTKWGLKLFQGMLTILDKQNCSAYNCEYCLTQNFNNIFWVLKRTVSLRRFF